MKPNIRITISGLIGTGKSTIGAIINKTLKEYGFDVDILSGAFDPSEADIVAGYEANLDPMYFSNHSAKATVSIKCGYR